MNNNKVMRLNEEDLHMLVEQAVINVLVNEGMIDEGGTGFLKSMFNRGRKRVQNNIQKAQATVGGKIDKAVQAGKDAYNQGKEAVTNAYNQGREAVNGAYNQGKEAVTNAYNQAVETGKDWYRTGQVGSINQDAQKAINNAVNALNQLNTLNDKLVSMGQSNAIPKEDRNLIATLINHLQNRSAVGISGQFNGRNSQMVNKG